MTNPCAGTELESIGEPPFICNLASMASWLRSFYYAVCSALAPDAGASDGHLTGFIYDYAGSTVPANHLACDGAAVSRATYAALFTAIGTTYGSGDGATTFNLPDLRGRTTSGMDNLGTGAGAANRVVNAQADILGGNVGAENVTLVANQLPTLFGNIRRGSSGNILYNTNYTAAGGYDGTVNLTGNAATILEVTNSGGSQSHNNMQPTLFLKKCIRI